MNFSVLADDVSGIPSDKTYNQLNELKKFDVVLSNYSKVQGSLLRKLIENI